MATLGTAKSYQAMMLFLAAKAAPISRNVRSLVSQLVSQLVNKLKTMLRKAK